MDMQRLLEAEPFLGYVGLQVLEARRGTAVLRLKLRQDVSNHADTVHGGAQYALGEATAIALAATLFPGQIAHLDLVSANATIAYRRAAHGDLTARAELPDDECERVRGELDQHGRVRFPVAVTLTDADSVVATTLTVEVAARLRS
jgi:uncharacterized protein (TIGR00369 family)